MGCSLLLKHAPTAQSYVILVTASSEATSSTVQPLDSTDDDREEETRVIVFELRIVLQGDPEGVQFTKLGDWSLNGPVDSVALCQDQNGMYVTCEHMSRYAHTPSQETLSCST